MLRRAHWHFNPQAFITQFKQCGWLSAVELAQCIPRNVIEQTRDSQRRTRYPQSSISWSTALNRASNYVKVLNQTFQKYGLSANKLRIAYFLANSIQETIYFTRKSELGGTGTRYAPWYGRGFLQLTWEINYRRYGNYRGWNNQATSSFRDSLEHDNFIAADSAGYYWISCAKPLNATVNINQYADVIPNTQASTLSKVCPNYSYPNRTCNAAIISIPYYPSTEFERTARAVNTGNANSTSRVNGLIPRNNVFANCINVLLDDSVSLNTPKQR